MPVSGMPMKFNSSRNFEAGSGLVES
jgi:hypothetical protein